jgi:DNA ligase (NAD+)
MEKEIPKLLENHIDYGNKISIKKLVDLLQYLTDLYHNTSDVNKIVSDKTYDELEEILKIRSPNNKYFKNIGAQVNEKQKVKLPVRMPSLEKKKDEKSINLYINKFKNNFVLSDKLDGVSAMYHNGKLYKRGDGDIGTEISSFIKPLKIKIPDNLYVRGELIIPKKFHSNFSNTDPRNVVSGYLNANTIDNELTKYIEFVAYELIDSDLSPEEQFNILDQFKIKRVETKIIKDLTIKVLQDYLILRKEKSKYTIDGIVIYHNSPYEIPTKTKSNPKYAFAFKMDLDEQKEITTVIEVEYNASKDGNLIPRVIFEPVKIGGVTINKATAHNAKFIKDKKIGPGSVIEIIRSGDVIPKIINVIKPNKEGFMPEGNYHWNETNTHLVLDNKSEDKSVLSSNILNFINKMKIDHVNIGLVNKFIDHGLDTINKIIEASVDDFLEIEGIKEKMASKIYNNIQEKIKSCKLEQVMHASNIFGTGLGERKLKLIIDQYPDILTKSGDLLSLIIGIDGFAQKTAQRFIDKLPEFKQFLKQHPKIKISTCKEAKNKKASTGTKYTNQVFVFSGFRDNNLKEKIESQGGIVNDSINSKTTTLVVKEKSKTTGKIKKALDMGVVILQLDEFK